MMLVVPDEKRTKIGTGPVRPATGAGHAIGTPQPGPASPGMSVPPSSRSVPATPVMPAEARPSLPPGAVGTAIASIAPPDAVTPILPSTPAWSTPPAQGTSPSAAHSTSYLPPKTDPLLGQVVAGRYLIQRKLGEGGMGAVYLATHNVLEKQVALKVLHNEFARKSDLVERFMQEAKSASRIRHENVIDISDFGATPDGQVFFAMELLKGHDLHEDIARARLAGQLLPWERSKKIFLQICAALSAAHALNIVHRDLKPENVYLVEFLGEPDFVKLLDFGIAKVTDVSEGEGKKLTRTGMLFGTPEYMSPEQARGDTVDARVDIYAMGCILFQLVTGRVPFEADNFMGVLTRHLVEPPPVIPPEVFDSIGAPRELALVIDQALAKEREHRFAKIEDFARAVRIVSGDRTTGPVPVRSSVPAPPSATMNRVRTQWTGSPSVPEIDAALPRKSRLPLILGAIVVAGAAAAVAVLATRGSGPPSAVTQTTGSQVAPATAQTPDKPPGQGVSPAAPTPVTTTTGSDDPDLAFSWSRIRLETNPPGAEVKDLATGQVMGRTPLPFKLRPSRVGRQFGLHLKDYLDTVVELVPDRPTIEHTEPLERGAGKAPVVRRVSDPNAKVPPVPAPGSDAPVAAGTPPAPPPPPQPPPRLDDDCGDPPCLKPDPSRQPLGSATP
jgi:eukaryotic-like serine/threonine-protein kinase